jgi:hypothetical protein
MTHGQKNLRISTLGVLVASMILVWGCKNDPDPSGAGNEREECTLKYSACVNECHKADTLKECPNCCRVNAQSCDVGKSYSFYS